MMHRTTARTISAALLAIGVASGALLGNATPAAAQALPPRQLPPIPPIQRNLPDLTVALSASKSQVDTGEEFTVNATVRNPGTTGTAGIALQLNLDEATFVSNVTAAAERENFVCASASGGHQVNCTSGLLEGNGDAQLRFKVKAPAQNATVSLSARVDPNGVIRERSDANNAASATVRVVALPDLAVQTLDGPEALNGNGVDASYRFTVRNNGGGTATSIRVAMSILSMPLKFQIVDIEGDRHGFSCSISSNKDAVCTGGTLAPGQSLRVRMDTETQFHVGANPGTLRVSVTEAQTDRATANNTASKAINVR